jgi:hypothetical protein
MKVRVYNHLMAVLLRILQNMQVRHQGPDAICSDEICSTNSCEARLGAVVGGVDASSRFTMTTHAETTTSLGLATCHFRRGMLRIGDGIVKILLSAVRG